jgi:hypothetical protein
VIEASERASARSVLSRLPVRTRVGLAVTVVFALVSDGQFLVKALVDYVRTSRPTAIEVYLSRFGEIRTALPARGVVGYVAEPKGKEILHGGDYYRKFHLAQYALAPLIIVDSPDRPLVIGNFASGTPPPQSPGLSLVRDYGNGVMLFRRPGE